MSKFTDRMKSLIFWWNESSERELNQAIKAKKHDVAGSLLYQKREFEKLRELEPDDAMDAVTDATRNAYYAMLRSLEGLENYPATQRAYKPLADRLEKMFTATYHIGGEMLGFTAALRDPERCEKQLTCKHEPDPEAKPDHWVHCVKCGAYMGWVCTDKRNRGKPCVYDDAHDPMHDFCLHCGAPEERK